MHRDGESEIAQRQPDEIAQQYPIDMRNQQALLTCFALPLALRLCQRFRSQCLTMRRCGCASREHLLRLQPATCLSEIEIASTPSFRGEGRMCAFQSSAVARLSVVLVQALLQLVVRVSVNSLFAQRTCIRLRSRCQSRTLLPYPVGGDSGRLCKAGVLGARLRTRTSWSR